MYKQTARNQFCCILYTKYSFTSLPCVKIEAALPPRLDLSPDEPGKGQLTSCPSARWKGLFMRVYPPFLSEESFLAWAGQASKQELLGSLTQMAGCARLYHDFQTKKEICLNPIIALNLANRQELGKFTAMSRPFLLL